MVESSSFAPAPTSSVEWVNGSLEDIFGRAPIGSATLEDRRARAARLDASFNYSRDPATGIVTVTPASQVSAASDAAYDDGPVAHVARSYPPAAPAAAGAVDTGSRRA